MFVVPYFIILMSFSSFLFILIFRNHENIVREGEWRTYLEHSMRGGMESTHDRRSDGEGDEREGLEDGGIL